MIIIMSKCAGALSLQATGAREFRVRVEQPWKARGSLKGCALWTHFHCCKGHYHCWGGLRASLGLTPHAPSHSGPPLSSDVSLRDL